MLNVIGMKCHVCYMTSNILYFWTHKYCILLYVTQVLVDYRITFYDEIMQKTRKLKTEPLSFIFIPLYTQLVKHLKMHSYQMFCPQLQVQLHTSYVS